MAKAERLSKDEQLAEKGSFEGNCENFQHSIPPN